MKTGYYSFFVFILIIFSLGCYYHYPFLSDDSLISLRYAQRFIEAKGLTWNDGQPVEGYSNLLWILLISFLGKQGMDLILAARILGILCSAGTMAVVLAYFKTKNIKKEYVFLAVFLLVTTPCFTVWAIGGLEQPLYIFLLTLALTEVSKIINDKNSGRMYLLSLWLGLLAITRPDGFLFTMVTAAFLFFFFRRSNRDLVKVFFIVALVPALFLLGQLFFRYNLYGELVPNTALVKVKITAHHVLRGGFYILKAFAGTFLLSVLGLCGLIHLVYKKKNPFGFYLLLNVVAWTAYVILVGGDIFPAFRHYYVVLILLVFAIIFSLEDLQSKLKKSVRIGFIIFLIINAFIQLLVPANEYAIGERWEFRGLKLGKTLENSFPETTVVAVTAAGCIPYASELPAIDMLGLNDYYTPRHPPKNFGTGALAHELGDATYVLGRNPDIIIYHMGAEPQFNIGEQMKINPVFKNDYVKVLARRNNDRHILYFNKYGKSTGIIKKGNVLIIPAYLMSTSTGDESIFNWNGKLLKHLQKGKRYTLSLQNPDSEKWELSRSSEILFSQDPEIRYGKNSITITIRPENELFLESLELHRKYE